MERIITPEERIRRAEEIYYRRKSQGVRVSTGNVSIRKNNSMSLGKKMIIQIIVCILIYMTFWMIKGYNKVFSESFINQTKNILEYDMNFQNLYNQCLEYFNNIFNNIIKIEDTQEKIEKTENDKPSNNEREESEETNVVDNQKKNQENYLNGDSVIIDENLLENQNINSEKTDNNSGGAESEELVNGGSNTDTSNNIINDGTQKAKIDAENVEQMHIDAEYIKGNYNMIHPIQGTVTSKFGSREETEIISAFHQGIDIAAVTGTPVVASMEGTVIASSYAGEYGNHIKIQNNDVLTVYAHCSELDVKVGEHIIQGQEIAKVGATGKATGPHLHFEIRRDGRYINPELIMDF